MSHLAPYALLVLVVACGSGEGGEGAGGGASDAGGAGTLLERVVRLAEGDGHVVQETVAAPFFIDDCEGLPTCYAANATSPYALWMLPPAPGDTLPQGDTPSPPRTPEGTSPAFRLRADEVVIYTGRTSPSAAYFSYAPYVFDRLNPATGERVQLFASLSDALNLVNLSTAAGGPFDAETVVILTAHAEMESRARQWLTDAGYDPATFNTLVIPSDQAQMGLDPTADTFMLLQRFALFDDPTEGRAYLEDLPVSILRITPTEERDADPIPTPARTPRGTGRDESALEPALDALEAAIVARHGPPSDEAFTMASAELITSVFDPLVCMRDFTECLGEVSDTTYSAGPIEVARFGGTLHLTNDPDDYFIAFGVNHEASGKATYSNVVVNNWDKQAGIAAFDSRQMPGSAAIYLPDHPDVDQLFAVKVTRDCGGDPNCVEVPTDFPGVPLDGNLLFLFRAYLEPGTSVSPGPTEILSERVLHYVP